MSRTTFPSVLLFGILAMNSFAAAEEFKLSLRTIVESPPQSGLYRRSLSEARWSTAETAIIVCDVWDRHHCLNAVRRMEEFLPRMNDVLVKARREGATIIHSPSDCMAAYESHPARRRAVDTPAATNKPQDVEFWCSKIPAEQQADYPIDQSDGGEDDDPAEHAKWAAELKALGRNPGLPWQAQNDHISIDGERDFISDRGDEVWNILENRGIKNVILVGVHTNMCVLGRPFGLRQMVRNGRNVVLMRDMTDCMYNPKRWPFVDHFTGNDLIVSHVEQFVCPTITSDQIVGGEPFVSKFDTRTDRGMMGIAVDAGATHAASFNKHWTAAIAGSTWKSATRGAITGYDGAVWYRCSVRLPSMWLTDKDLRLKFSEANPSRQAWLNGTLLKAAADDASSLLIPRRLVTADDIDLLVIRTSSSSDQERLAEGSAIQSGLQTLELNGRWQFRMGDDPSWSNIPLPAKFGMGSDVLFEAK